MGTSELLFWQLHRDYCAPNTVHTAGLINMKFNSHYLQALHKLSLSGGFTIRPDLVWSASL